MTGYQSVTSLTRDIYKVFFLFHDLLYNLQSVVFAGLISELCIEKF